MTIKRNSVSIFPFEIHLPDESISTFWIFHDLADLFGFEFNSEASDVLISAIGTDPNLESIAVDIDNEADYVSIHCSTPDDIFFTAQVINDLSIEKYKTHLENQELINLKKELNSWIKPKKQEWDTGDIFSFKLDDGYYGYGQVLDNHGLSATCGLFKIRYSQSICDLKVFRKKIVISILNVISLNLDSGSWLIIGNKSRCEKPSKRVGKILSGVGAKSFSAGILERLANAWFGLVPWNCGVIDGTFDSILLKGVRKPETAIMLNEEECKDYLSEGSH